MIILVKAGMNILSFQRQRETDAHVSFLLTTQLTQTFYLHVFLDLFPHVHNWGLIPELGGPWEMLCSTRSNALLQAHGIALTETINEQNIEQISSFKGYMLFGCVISYIQKIFVHSGKYNPG